jgi:thiol-disulfide isomerase/thioredoxin
VRIVAALAAAAALQAPTLAGADVVSGKPLSLRDYRGRVVVVNVWGSWCGGCIAEAADLRRFVSRHPRIVVLGLDSEDSLSAARAFYRRHGLRHPSIFDPSGTLARRLRLQGLPTTLFLDRRHRIVARVTGAGTLAEFERALRVALGR